MSKQSEAVKAWRRRTKQKMINGFGGKCGICGYDRCDATLDFHHINPLEKDFGFGKIRASIISWEKNKTELQKCVMLCANCHREVHFGLHDLELIESLPRFDENLCGDFLNGEVKKTKTGKPKAVYYCSCGNKRKKHAEFCSPDCYNKQRQKFDWSTVDLIELSKIKSNCEIAKDCGVSEATIRKRIKKLMLL